MRAILLIAATLTVAVPSFAEVQAPGGSRVARGSFPRSGKVQTPDGVTIHYVESGSGPAMLLVPGWTMTGEIFAPQISRFSSRHRVVAMDPRGQGRSSQNVHAVDPATRAGDIKAVIDRLKLAPVVLVGWSNGVTDIAAFIDRFGTADVSALVLVDGTAGGTLEANGALGAVKFLGSFAADRRNATAAFVKSMYRRPRTEAYLRAITAASLRTTTPNAVALALTTLAADYRPALARIDKPTLLVVAESPFMRAYEAMRDAIPGVQYEVMTDVGHALFVDDAEGFNARVEAFLSALSRRD